MNERQKVLAEINAERDRQEAKWGPQNHQPERWLSILGEEFGEVCKAVCEATFPGYETTGDWSQYRSELIHVAAVAAAMAECFDRRGEVLAEGRTLHNGVVVNEWSLYKTKDDQIDAHNKKVVAEAREINRKHEDGSVQGDVNVVCSSHLELPVKEYAAKAALTAGYLSSVVWSNKSPEVLEAVRKAYIEAHKEP